ncbi:MAG: AlkZ family DNA glycosylase [Bacteroidales bacterium]|nr:AlkZ family DNA glycosylase [Bacteroidales bacterium]
MNPVSLRLLNQQLAAPQFSDPAEVVDYLGALQAQEYRLMRWGVAMRTRKPSAEAFGQAYDDGRIIRLHLMRGTWQLVSAADYWPLLGLCGTKALSVIKGWMSSNKISIPDDEARRIGDILAQTAADRGSVTKEDFVEALAAKGIVMDDHRLSYHIRFAELSGTLCNGNLLPYKATYALTAHKVGPSCPTDRDETLAMLTSKYFRSRQPATLEDYMWWSGLNMRDCRRGIEMLGGYLHRVTWGGREFYLTDDCRTRGLRHGSYLFLPPYDEYLIGYKSRDIVLEPQHSHMAHNNSGNFKPIIALDGVVCGNWAPFSEECRAEFFLGDHDPAAPLKEWTRYRNFLRTY